MEPLLYKPAGVKNIVDFIAQNNPVVQSLDIKVTVAEIGNVSLSMKIKPSMSNSNGICHGGYIFLLADQAAGFCSMSHNQLAVTQSSDIHYISPGKVNEILVATAKEKTRTKRTGLYDVEITGMDNRLVALMRSQFVITGPELVIPKQI
ncbi:MAG: hotdog fold thioesterase [Proteobacteria bacterium]|nr:hotdog fold thioesterase [Pseudomonadota bacterium]